MDDFDADYCRPFTSGSREPPDRQDGFLESAGFYRKHTARDPSSLFRVVSEHVFDIQMYHEKVRQDCASFLEKNRIDYEKDMDKNFYYYMNNLRKVRTPGTLLELRALAHCYKRNVMLFEPFTTGKWYINEENYHKDPIRVYYTADKHFDTIFPKEDIELAAKCQGYIFELLYKHVFQLPDVPYAVERMLHDQTESTTKPLKDDPTKYQTLCGKVVDFDSPEGTLCVLENSMMCHFHNRNNFEEFVESYGASVVINTRRVFSSDNGRPLRKQLDACLYDKNKSCVRQLLDEKITPFPYKVAKALDRSIYRNIEFDLWNDNRKELRMKWGEGNPIDTYSYRRSRPRMLCNDLNSNVNVDQRAPTQVTEPLSSNQENSMKSSTFPEKYVMYIDPFVGDKTEVCIGGDLLKSNLDKKYIGKSGIVDKSYYYYPHYTSGYGIVKEDWGDDLKKKVGSLDDVSYAFKMDNFTDYHHFQPHETDAVVMPASLHSRGYYRSNKRGGMRGNQNMDDKNDNNQNNGGGNQGDGPPMENNYNQQYYEQVQYVPYDAQQQQQQNPPNAMPIQQMHPQSQMPTVWNPPGPYMPQGIPSYPQYVPQYYAPPTHPFYPQYSLPSMTVPPPMQFATMATNPVYVPQLGLTINDSLNLIRDIDMYQNLNVNVRECADAKDLPSNDVSAQFFHNLGVRYFQHCVAHPIHPTGMPISTASGNSDQAASVESGDLNTNNLNLLLKDEDNKGSGSATNSGNSKGNGGGNAHNDQIITTPVTTKVTTILQNSAHKQPGSNPIGHGNNNQRRGGPFLGPRMYHHRRNDVRFNSNVKNVHKSETLFPKPNSSGASTLTTSTANNSLTSTIPHVSPLSPIPYEEFAAPTQPPQQNLPNAIYQTPFYTPQVVPFYQENEQVQPYMQPMPAATYISVPMPPQNGPHGPVIYQQPVDHNLSADSGIIEAQYTQGNYQPMIYVTGPPNQSHYAATAPPNGGNYVYYTQSVPQTPQMHQVPMPNNSAPPSAGGYQPSPGNNNNNNL